MTIDLNDTEGRTLIPPGVYALKIQVNYGNAGSDGVLRRAKNGHSLMLELECTVLDSKHAGRKIWEYLTVELDDNGSPLAADKLDKLKTSVRIGRNKLRDIVDSAHHLDPNDTGEAAQKKRRLESYGELDELVFWAQIEKRAGDNGYGPRNYIDFVITPNLPDYPKKKEKEKAQTVVPVEPDMDDSIPF
jgi:hypothetical protein